MTASGGSGSAERADRAGRDDCQVEADLGGTDPRGQLQHHQRQQSFGVFVFGIAGLVTHNTAVNNGEQDFLVGCPSDVTFNASTAGFPASYSFGGGSCHTVGND